MGFARWLTGWRAYNERVRAAFCEPGEASPASCSSASPADLRKAARASGDGPALVAPEEANFHPGDSASGDCRALPRRAVLPSMTLVHRPRETCLCPPARGDRRRDSRRSVRRRRPPAFGPCIGRRGRRQSVDGRQGLPGFSGRRADRRQARRRHVRRCRRPRPPSRVRASHIRSPGMAGHPRAHEAPRHRCGRASEGRTG